jgi:5-hydroxyisourate hydrolase
MSKLTTHVLDTALGRPAHRVTIILEGLEEAGFKVIGRGVTNEDGRVPDILAGAALTAGTYKMTFHTKEYLATTDRVGFYPYVEVVFEVTNALKSIIIFHCCSAPSATPHTAAAKSLNPAV